MNFGSLNNRMYFIQQGEVALMAGGRTLDTIRAGEIFGEMALVKNQPAFGMALLKAVADRLRYMNGLLAG